jgi:hypothetical protein
MRAGAAAFADHAADPTPDRGICWYGFLRGSAPGAVRPVRLLAGALMATRSLVLGPDTGYFRGLSGARARAGALRPADLAETMIEACFSSRFDDLRISFNKAAFGSVSSSGVLGIVATDTPMKRANAARSASTQDSVSRTATRNTSRALCGRGSQSMISCCGQSPRSRSVSSRTGITSFAMRFRSGTRDLR